jgi:hypothetical protein
MNNKVCKLVLVFFLLAGSNLFSQSGTHSVRYQVALFTPLYLDSAFDESNSYRYGMNFPKFINPGLEFYEGAQMAIDSLNREGIPLDVYVYDSRSRTSDIQTAITNPAFDSIDLIIGQVNAAEARQLAAKAAQKDIPFINATYPNDAGVSNNPNYVILNSTLYTHFNAMYRYIQKNYSLYPIIYFTKKGTAEDRVKAYFDEIAKNTSSVPLKIKFVTLEDQFTVDDIKENLDDDRTTICIAGSLDAAFGEQLTTFLSSLYSDQRSILFAMPTWWDVTDFTKPEYKSVEVIFTTPFYVQPTNPIGIRIENNFKARFYSRPTDMVFRGFETVFHFVHLLQVNGKNLGSALSDKRFRVFSEFDIQPVLDPKTNTLDYFENKKIYFIKKVDGIVTAVY